MAELPSSSWFFVIVENDGLRKSRELLQISQLEDETLASTLPKFGSADDSHFEFFVSDRNRPDVKLPNNAKMRVRYDFRYNFGILRVRSADNRPSRSQEHTGKCALDVMKRATKSFTHLPIERKGRNANDRFYNDLLYVIREFL